MSEKYLSLLKFRKRTLAEDQTIEEWLIENEDDINENTRYTFYNEDGEIVGEYIGNTEVKNKINEELSKDYNDLINKPVIPEKTSDLINDSDFTTKDYVDNEIANAETSKDYNDLINKPSFKTINGESILGSGDINIEGGGTGADFYRVRIFSDNNKLITTQILYEGEKVEELDKPGRLFDYGTGNEFDYNNVITEDTDLIYSEIPTRYVQTTTADFNSNGDYNGTEEYIILPKDKTSGYRIQNSNVKGVATNGDYLTNTADMFRDNNSLYLELDYLNTSNVTTISGMFRGSQATELDLSNFDTSKVTSMSGMFWNSQATTLNLSSFDTSNVTNMSYMFMNTQVTELDLSNFDTSKVTNMREMFNGSEATTLDLSNFNTSNVTNMRSMFRLSKATTIDLSNFDTSNVTNMGGMFGGSQATTLDVSNFNTNNVTNMNYMFQNSQATELDVSNFDTSNVTDMSGMFGSTQATTLDLSNFDTSNVTDMNYMFENSQATELDVSNFDTSNVTSMNSMFSGSEATTLDLSSFDTSNVTVMNFMFRDSQATTGYARTQNDADNFNNSTNKPSSLTFVVK